MTEQAGVREASSELHEYLSAQGERKKLFPKALLVGVLSGLVAVAFRAALAGSDALRSRVITWAHTFGPVGILIPILFTTVAAALAFWIVRVWVSEASGSGIPHLEMVLHRYRTLRWERVLPAKFLGGVLGIGSGLALGREGPTIQMGGAVGTGVASYLKVGKREGLTLTAAGAGAGLAAAFNAPLAGLVFVLEELQRDFRPSVFGAAFVAAAGANVVARLFSGQLPVFEVPAYPTPALNLLPAFAVLGLVAGGLGIVFNRTLMRMLNGVARLRTLPRWGLVLGVGALVGAVAFFVPAWVGAGHGVAEEALSGKTAMALIPLYFLVRFAMTMGSYGTGVPGGVFAPMLALGALLGLEVGNLAALAFPSEGVLPGAFAVVGMAAYFTAIVRAPLTGIVLIAEMTSSYALMLPLLVACLVSYAVAEAMGDLPIYEALTQRELLTGGAPVHQEPMVVEAEVEPGAPFDGLCVRDLALPAGLVLVRCQEGNREWVPQADTVLHSHVRLTAVVSPEAEDGLRRLREGCEA